jgi:hypothetical protein
MKISGSFKAIVAIIIIGLMASGEIYMYINGYYYEHRLFNFIWNIFYETKIDIKYFEIDVPKFYWLSAVKSDIDINKYIFLGTPAFMDKENIDILTKKLEFLYETPFKTMWHINKRGIRPLLTIENFNEYTIDTLIEICNVSLVKSSQKISNSELEAYDCINENFKNIPSRFVIYKDIYFNIDLYISAFKPQYDKFFEGVRLKE